MDSFVYDYYGYNFKLSKEHSVVYQGYIFKLFFVNETEESIKQLNDLSLLLARYFNNDVVYIVKNKYNKYISNYLNDNSICLLTYKNQEKIDVSMFAKLHIAFFNYFDYKVKLENIIVLWDERVEYILNQCLVNLNFDNYTDYLLYQYSMSAIGMSYNALQYLRDIQIDFNRKNYSCTLTHRRIHKLSKLEFFNPFNLIIDHSSRDLAELYKNDLIDLSTLLKLCNYYNYQIDEYEYILARLLFPTSIFDVIEDLSSLSLPYEHKNEVLDSIKQYKLQVEKLKQYYNSIISFINIRPIEWINHFNL